MKRRSVVARLLAVALGCVVAAAVAEGILRVTGAGVYAPRVSEYGLVRAPGQIWFTPDPNRPTTHRWDGDPYGRLPPGAEMTYEIGSHRLRGTPPPRDRPAVVVLGDSFTFGEGVRLEDTFVARLERAFAARRPAPAFVNAGVPGYGTREEAARLPHLLAEFRPVAVLVVAMPNDAVPLDDSMEVDDFVRRKDAGEGGLRLVALVRGVATRGARDRAVEDWYRSYYFGERRAHWEEARRGLASMQYDAKSAGAAFGVVMFPLLHRVAERPFADIHELFRATCDAQGTPFLDLTDALAVESDRALWVHPTDHHPDARAHELAAEALVPFVSRLLDGGR